MRLKLFFLLLIAGNAAFSQTARKVIAGTKYSMIPPDGFVAAVNFSGFQHNETGSSIMVSEIPTNFKTLADGFTADNLKAKGMLLIDKKEIDLNGSKAYYLTVKQKAGDRTYLKQILLCGDANRAAIINGIYPEESGHLEADIKKSLLSISYNVQQSENPLDAATFKVDVSGTPFQFTKFLSGALLYTVEGKIPSTKPGFTVAPSHSEIAVADQKQYSLNRLKQFPRGETVEVKETNPIEIDGLKGYEIIGQGKSEKGQPELVYVFMIYKDKGYYIFYGASTEDFEKYTKLFRNIAKTFKRK